MQKGCGYSESPRALDAQISASANADNISDCSLTIFGLLFCVCVIAVCTFNLFIIA